jgi:hypothetical protein
VLAGMGETIGRDELAREVAERLDADPGLVMRRLAGEGSPRREPARTRAQPTTPRPQEVSGNGEGAMAPRRPVELNSRERREQALLAMCIASPRVGREFLSKLEDEHLSSAVTVRARDWLRAHLDAPVEGLPREDQELVSLVTKLAAQAGREPATPEAMELNFLELQKRAVEAQLSGVAEAGGDNLVRLQRERADLMERIARHRT